ncbi:MAG: hypothetical protein HXS47_02365 [Theionarchaea archaeon]|nr:hypothetical protein [Theionarchaea archaeon]
MKWFIWVLLIVTGCLQQGIKGVHYITGEIDSIDKDNNGIAEGIHIFIAFRDHDGEALSFSDAQCQATITCSIHQKIIYEKSVSFETSSSVGEGGGIILLFSDPPPAQQFDIDVTVEIEGRGIFQWTKPEYSISS